MRRHIVQAIIGTMISLSLLTACGSREAASADSELSVFSYETESAIGKAMATEPVYCISEEAFFDNGGYVFGLRFQYEYDTHGNKVKQTTYDSFGKVSNWSEYEYTADRSGCSVKKTTYNQSGAKTSVEYGYDAGGDMTERICYRGNDLLRTKFFDAQAESCMMLRILYQAKAAADKNEVLRYISYDNDVVTEFATARYDAAGNRIEENIYFADGSLMYAYEYEYDASGNITKEAVYDANGTLLNTAQFEYLYDEYGNVLEKTEYQDGDFTALIKYSYIEV